VVAIVLAAAGVLALLIWVGRRPVRLTNTGRLLSTLFAAITAAAAVVSALRGGWIPSLLLVACSAYLGRGAQQAARPTSPSATTAMSEVQARSILGVGSVAGEDEIRAAYRRLMRRAHPDHGGSDGLAAQLNAARDRLLNERR
jgi:hypothetical protein